MRLPGPSDLVGAVRDLAGATATLGRAAASAVELVPRFVSTLDAVDLLVARADVSLTRLEEITGGAALVLTHVQDVVAQSATAVTHVQDVVAQSQASVARAFDVLAGAGGLVDTTDHLLSRARPALEQLLPVLQRLADTFDEHEVEAAVLLLDRLPVLLESVDRDLLPLAGALNSVGPELHSLLGLVEDLHRMVEGLPGVRLLRRRGSES